MKNRIALKLSLYFAIILLIFSVIIGCIFIILFRNHTISLHKNELEKRASSISETLSEFLNKNTNTSGMHSMGGTGGFGAYLRYISDIAGTDVWIVDKDLNLLTNGKHDRMVGSNYVYTDLPDNADQLVKEVFTDKTVFSEDFSSVLSESVLTVGTPIKNSSTEVIGVVLLHSPVRGTDEAVIEGAKLLLASLCAALVLGFLLSLWLSKNFTNPIINKESADALRLENVRREFVANISHELKTPVTVIRSSLEALVEKVVTDPVQVDEYHSQMLKETVFLQRLVCDLLDLSRLQNVDFALEKTEMSILDCLEDAIKSVSRLARNKGVTISTFKKPETRMISGDYGRVRQMFLVVLDNAIKFSPDSGVIEVIWDGNNLVVRDHGAGIPEEDLPHIFERFFKSRSEQNKTGTGLGLSIAKQIAVRHNIELSAESNEGADFIFSFKKP